MRISAYLLELMAPDQRRWKPMLMGLALSAAAAGTAVLVQPNLVFIPFVMLSLAAWFAGACAMVGYARWFFASEIAQARRDHSGPDGGKD
jgi:membrane protein YqaA with SNARE-associated domain